MLDRLLSFGRIQGRHLRYRVLSEADYKSEYQSLFEKVAVKTEKEKEEFYQRFKSIRESIVRNLRRISSWTEEEDWATGYDYNYCYYACGGVYSKKAFSPDYVLAIANGLEKPKDPISWAYHTVCEIEVNPEGRTAEESEEDWGEFFIKNREVVILNTMKKEHRKLLGCEE